MTEAWDLNAPIRHKQLIDRKDITFWEILLPEILKVLKGLDGYDSFSVLDAGCGTGILSHILSAHVARVTGIDPSSVSISIAQDYAREDQNVTLQCVGIEEFGPLHTGEFDFALGHMVLQAIEPLSLALESISMCTRARGVFVFSIPHPCFWAIVKNEFDQTNYSYRIPSYYQIPFPVSSDSNPFPSRIPYFHRPLEIYSTELFKAGFVIERLQEPFPSDELMKAYARPWIYPGFLIVVCRKR